MSVAAFCEIVKMDAKEEDQVWRRSAQSSVKSVGGDPPRWEEKAEAAAGLHQG